MPAAVVGPREAVFRPTELSEEEFNGVLEQLRGDLTETDAAVELRDAARYKDIDVVRAVLCVYPLTVNSLDNHENTPLHMAAANGHVEIVKLLLQLGSDPSRRNDKGNTPLHWAASNGQQAAVEALLQHEQVDVLQRNTFGRSALTEGFESQNNSVVQSLLEHDSATEERLMQTDATMDDAGDQGVTHEFTFGGSLVRIRELPIAKTDDESILGQANPSDDTTGLGIWAASLVTAQWMVFLRHRFAGQTVVELGAGCGVPSLAIARHVPTCKLYATDFNPRTVENLRHNVELNECSPQVSALEMNWQDPSTWPSEPVSMVIGSDLIYQADMVPLLRQTIQALLRPGGVFLYAAPATGRQGQHDLFRLLVANGEFRVEEHPFEAALKQNPLASQDDDLCFLHFHELRSTEYKLYEFTKQS
jgi:predicted nicotinamide N-methyase